MVAYKKSEQSVTDVANLRSTRSCKKVEVGQHAMSVHAFRLASTELQSGLHARIEPASDYGSQNILVDARYTIESVTEPTMTAVEESATTPTTTTEAVEESATTTTTEAVEESATTTTTTTEAAVEESATTTTTTAETVEESATTPTTTTAATVEETDKPAPKKSKAKKSKKTAPPVVEVQVGS